LKAQEKTEVDNKTSGKHKQVKWTTKEDWRNLERYASAVKGKRKNAEMQMREWEGVSNVVDITTDVPQVAFKWLARS